MGKNRRIKRGGTKNQNKCSVFPAAYKLDYLHTNLKIKPLNKNYQNPSKSSISPIYSPKIQYRTQYRKPPLKSTLSPTTQSKSKITIQTTFFLYKYKNPNKIHTFTDYQLFIKNHINNIKFHTYLKHKKRNK